MTKTIGGLMIMVIIIAMFTSGLFTYFSGVSNEYNLNLSDSGFSNKTIAKINQTSQIATGVTGRVDEQGVETGGDEATTLFRAGLGAAKLTLQIPGIVTSLIVDGFTIIQRYTGIPAAFQAGLLALLAVIVGFALIRLIFKVDL